MDEQSLKEWNVKTAYLDLFGYSEGMYRSERFKIDKRYVKIGSNGTVLQSDSPSGEWSACEQEKRS